jgi:predicted MPP superfamily phosphohydrolase
VKWPRGGELRDRIGGEGSNNQDMPQDTRQDATPRSCQRERPVARLLLATPILAFFLFNGVFLAGPLSTRGLGFGEIRKSIEFYAFAFPAILILSGVGALYAARRDRAFGARMSSRTVVRMAGVSWVVLGGIGLSLGAYARFVAPYRIQVRRVEIRTPKVDRRVRIAHLSDIQSDRVGRYEEKVFERVRECKPDILIHTGDLLQPLPPATLESEGPRIAALIRGVDAALGKFAIYGDTDGALGDWTTEGLGGLRLLANEETTISLGSGGAISIWGMSNDQSRFGSSGDVADWVERAGPGAFTLLLGHSPDYILSVQNVGVDLCLAGHTHGGQIVPPFWGPVMTLSRIPNEWVKGFHVVGRTRLNVSAGVGCEHASFLPDVRFNCPPEFTIIDLVPEKM